LRAPFPSMATVATQAYICAVATHPGVRAEVSELVHCCQEAELSRTTFVRAIRSLAEAAQYADGAGRVLLEYEAEMTVFPEAVASAERRVTMRPEDSDTRDRHDRPLDVEKLGELRQAVVKLRRAAAKLGPRAIPLPSAQAAVIA